MIEIRRATTDDIEFIAEVLATVAAQGRSANATGGSEPVDTEKYHARAIAYTTAQLDEPEDGSLLSVVLLDDQPVGRLRVVRSAERIFLAGIQILPAYQRSGIGTSIITGLLEEGETAQLPVHLEVAKTNVRAQRLYRRLGFEQRWESESERSMVRRP